MNTIQVAAGIICRSSSDKQQYLISFRHPDRHQGGLWEFPGGKIEANESAKQALFRELKEELDIEITHSKPLFKITHQYSDKQVCLHISLVTAYDGKETGKENQKIRWVSSEELQQYDFPDANLPIIEYIINTGLRRHEGGGGVST